VSEFVRGEEREREKPGERGKMSVGEGSSEPGGRRRSSRADTNGQDDYLFRNVAFQRKRALKPEIYICWFLSPIRSGERGRAALFH
jgi:hypothetical protein